MVNRTFSTGICKNAKYSAQIIEKWQGNRRTSRGTINLGEAVLRRKRETEWSLKLRTLYPYGLNEKVNICDNDKNVKRFKVMMVLWGSYFLSCLDYFKGTKHVDMKTEKEYLF